MKKAQTSATDSARLGRKITGRYFYCICLLAACLALPATPAVALEKVTLQLKWTHAFQFAGYYAAKEQGYYREAGLDVNILEATPSTDPVRNVMEGTAQYGVGTSSLLLERKAGKPVVVLAVIFQQSPYEIYAAPGISHLQDLVGKRLMLEPQSDELLAYLKKEGLPLDQIQQMPHSFDANGLMEGKTEAISGYVSNEPYYFKQAHYPYQTFSPRSAGIDFYGDNLFTSEQELREHRTRVKAFRAASLKGWKYAKEHRHEVIQLILTRYSQQKTRDFLLFESDQMIPLLQPNLIEIGYMNPHRWRHIADTYAEIGLLPTQYSLDGFIYNAEKQDMTWFYRSLAFALLVILTISGVTVYIHRTNRQLRQSLEKNRQAEELQRHFERKLHQAQKLESLGVLAGGIAHDFNNILAVIIGHCGLLKLRPEKVADNIPQIEKAAERAAELVRQMLAYAGKTLSVITRIDMTALVDDMVRMLKATIPQNAVINFDIPAVLAPIMGDESQLRQIVMSLIINAAEACGDGEGEIRVSLADKEITAEEPVRDHLNKDVPQGRYVCLAVTDNGSGMDDATRDRIFEPFYTTKFTGRGLGMSATLGIVTAHKGFVSLESELGQGTTFRICLPVQSGEQAGEENVQNELPSSWQGSGTILLVEDEAQIRSIAQTMLGMLGFTILVAANGREALDLYRERTAEIILVMTDVGMPVMDGYQLIRALKKLAPQLPIIISSGFGDADVTAKIAGKDIAGLASKPYKFEQLRNVLQGVLAGVQSKL